MSQHLIGSGIEFMLGVLLNIFISKVEYFIFRSHKRGARISTRVVAVFCLIDGLLGIYHSLV